YLEPKGKPVGCVVAIPDADWTPEMLVGLSPGVPDDSQFARQLAENGFRVIVPVLIDRKDEWSGNTNLGRLTNHAQREFVYRMGFEMGRHVLGYEVQKVLAAVDWFKATDEALPVGLIGYGEGGLAALYTGAVDPRVKSTMVSGCVYSDWHHGWEEP